MSSLIILEVATGLSPEEVEHLRQLLYDAFGEFISVRSGGPVYSEGADSALAYVTKRYPEMDVAERARKADEVMLRKAIARKLRIAASDVRVEDAGDITMIEAAFVEGDRAAEVDGSVSPYPDDSLQHHWWTRGFSYKKRLLRAIEAEMALEAGAPVTPVAERVCEVLPTHFPQSVEEEAKILAEVIRDGQRDEVSPLTAYAAPRDDRAPDVEFDVERFPTKK